MRIGNLDAHDAELEELVDERPRNLRVLVHFPDERPDFGLGKRAHAVAEDRLVFGEHGQGLGVLDGVLGHDGPLFVGSLLLGRSPLRSRRRLTKRPRRNANVIIGPAPAGPPPQGHASYRGPPYARTSLVGIGLALPLVAGMQARQYAAASAAATGDSTDHGTAADFRPNRRPTPAAGSAAGSPRIRSGINYVRVDAIVTDRQGNPVSI